MKNLSFALALALAAAGCAAQAPAPTTPIDLDSTHTPRVAIAPPGTMDFVYDETPTRERSAAPPPGTSLRAGICEKPRHLFAAP